VTNRQTIGNPQLIDNPQSAMSNPQSAIRNLQWLLLLLVVCPYFVNLGSSSIWDANEAFYVETPREMMERGDYVYPTFNYEPRVNKPVLSYWIVAVFYKVFGVSVTVQRVPIAIGGLLLIFTSFCLAFAASPPAVARAAGWWAALGLAVSPRLLVFSRRIFIDIYISMFMGLTLLFFALAERFPQRRRLFLVLMYVSIGLGVLTKGPVAAVLPGLVILAYFIVHREVGRVRDLQLPLGTAVVIAIVAPWYVALYRQAGWSPIASFFLGENVQRFMDGTGVSVDRPFWWYLPVILSDSFPWSVLLVPAATLWIREWRSGGATTEPTFRLRTLLWLWIIVIVGFFSLSVAKQDLYIFPIVPAVFALAGFVIAKATEAPSDRPRVAWAVAMIAVLLLIAGIGFYLLFAAPSAVYVLAGATAVAVLGFLGGGIATVFAVRQRIAAALLTIACALGAISWVFVLRVIPSFEAYKPAPELAVALRQRAGPDDLIVTYNVAVPSLVYYLRRHTEVFYDHEPVIELLQSRRPLYLLLPEDDYTRAIEPGAPGALCKIAALPTFEIKLKNVIAREKPPEVWLMTNKCPGR
jgi:4-amino-4-deoxy-L-arabinose transferase-like glycosyltransferase